VTHPLTALLAVVQRAAAATCGCDILYQRAAESVAISDVTYGRSEVTVELAEEVRVEFTDRDFIVQASLLILNSLAVIPQRGDRILELDSEGETVATYEVLAPGGMRPYRYCDPQQTLLRIHTKKLS